MNGMLGGGGGGFKVPELQADAVLSQANPVSGTLYTVLATTSNVRIYGVSAKVTWTVQPSPLQSHFTVDGQTVIYNRNNPATATFYFLYKNAAAAANAQGMETAAREEAFLLEARSVLIEAETTGGTVSSLDIRVMYGKW